LERKGRKADVGVSGDTRASMAWRRKTAVEAGGRTFAVEGNDFFRGDFDSAVSGRGKGRRIGRREKVKAPRKGDVSIATRRQVPHFPSFRKKKGGNLPNEKAVLGHQKGGCGSVLFCRERVKCLGDQHASGRGGDRREDSTDSPWKERRDITTSWGKSVFDAEERKDIRRGSREIGKKGDTFPWESSGGLWHVVPWGRRGLEGKEGGKGRSNRR